MERLGKDPGLSWPLLASYIQMKKLKYKKLKCLVHWKDRARSWTQFPWMQIQCSFCSTTTLSQIFVEAFINLICPFKLCEISKTFSRSRLEVVTYILNCFYPLRYKYILFLWFLILESIGHPFLPSSFFFSIRWLLQSHQGNGIGKLDFLACSRHKYIIR